MVVRLSALRTDRLYPRKYSWYSFLLEVESTPGPSCDRNDFMSIKIKNILQFTIDIILYCKLLYLKYTIYLNRYEHLLISSPFRISLLHGYGLFKNLPLFNLNFLFLICARWTVRCSNPVRSKWFFFSSPKRPSYSVLRL
jgi:hypothetical protein